MALVDIRTAIRTAMLTVANVGPVTAYEPFVRRQEDFKTFFKDGALAYIQGWTITREASPERMRDAAHTNERTHVMVIRGYRAIDQDAVNPSEPAFQDLIEAVCNTLRAKENDQLDGTCLTCGPPSVRIFDPRAFGEFHVHYVEIAYPVTEPKSF